MNYLDKRAMEAIEHRKRERELNSIVFYRKSFASVGLSVSTLKTVARLFKRSNT